MTDQKHSQPLNYVNLYPVGARVRCEWNSFSRSLFPGVVTAATPEDVSVQLQPDGEKLTHLPWERIQGYHWTVGDRVTNGQQYGEIVVAEPFIVQVQWDGQTQPELTPIDTLQCEVLAGQRYWVQPSENALMKVGQALRDGAEAKKQKTPFLVHNVATLKEAKIEPNRIFFPFRRTLAVKDKVGWIKPDAYVRGLHPYHQFHEAPFYIEEIKDGRALFSRKRQFWFPQSIVDCSEGCVPDRQAQVTEDLDALRQACSRGPISASIWKDFAVGAKGRILQVDDKYVQLEIVMESWVPLDDMVLLCVEPKTEDVVAENLWNKLVELVDQAPKITREQE